MNSTIPIYLITSLIATTFLPSCNPTLIQTDPSGEAYISQAIGCNNLYNFSQDCTAWNGAARKITIDGFDIRVASTADGKVIWIMDGNFVANQFKGDGITEVPYRQAQSVQKGLNLVTYVLEKSMVDIERIRPVKDAQYFTVSYIIELDSEGYSLLKQYTKTK